MGEGNFPIVVIGASSGGIQALLEIFAELPDPYPAPIFVVVHVGAGRSMLPALITRGGALEASHAIHDEPFVAGHIYVAPPDIHMLVREDRIELTHGPRENHSRPAIDPLFRSAARAHGARVTGVILSGALGDGSAGLLTIKSYGGTVVVQDPEDAIVESMPMSALRLVHADHILSAKGVGRYLATIDSQPRPAAPSVDPITLPQDDTTDAIREDFEEQARNLRNGELTMFTCPDCGGTLWQTAAGPIVGFRCHVGHAWSMESLLGHKSVELEASLWSSIRLLEEHATLARQAADKIRASGSSSDDATWIDDQAEADDQRADTIRALLSVSVHAPVRAEAYGAEN